MVDHPATALFLAALAYADCLSGRTRRLADGLAARGWRVVFCGKPSLQGWWNREAGSARASGLVRRVLLPPCPGFARLYDRLPGRVFRRFVATRLTRAMAGRQPDVTVVSTPWWAPFLDDLPAGRLVYDCLDHPAVHVRGRTEGTYRAWEDALLARAHNVVAVSPALQRALSERAPAATPVCIPNGVPAAWSATTHEPVGRRALEARTDRPVAGFVGALFEWIDRELLDAVTARMPDVEFVFAGPQRWGVDWRPLASQPHVHVLPAVAPADVPRWIAAFDACLIPFAPGPVAECADPLKLYEYLAVGKPVVATHDFGHPDAPIRVARDADAFERALRQALAEADDPARTEERKAFASVHTWDARVDALLAAVATEKTDAG